MQNDLDFHSSILTKLSEEEKIEIFKEILTYQKTGFLTNGLLKKTANELNQMTIKDTIEVEIRRVELFVALFLAKKYIENI